MFDIIIGLSESKKKSSWSKKFRLTNRDIQNCFVDTNKSMFRTKYTIVSSNNVQ